jgi:hypothetical protein
MKNRESTSAWTRRNFLRGAGLLGVGGAVSAVSTQVARAAAVVTAPAAPAVTASEFERFRKTDPALVHYEETDAIPSPREQPRRIAFSPDGLLWLTAGRYVMGLDKEGTRTVEWTAGEDVTCVAPAADGNILVGLRERIEVFDRRGKSLDRWKAPARKCWFVSLAASAADVFATDAGNRLVYHFDLAGHLKARLGQKDKDRDIPAFVVPSPYFDLEIGNDGWLWVVNPGFHQLQAFTFDGALVKKWGEPSFSIRGFCGCCNPSYFTRLADGRFVTSEKGLPRVKVYSAAGEFESVVAGSESFPKYFESVNTASIPMDVAADASGRIFVADALGQRVRVYRRKQTA